MTRYKHDIQHWRIAVHEVGHLFGEFIATDGDISRLNGAHFVGDDSGCTEPNYKIGEIIRTASAKEKHKSLIRRIIPILSGTVSQSKICHEPFDKEGASSDIQRVKEYISLNGCNSRILEITKTAIDIIRVKIPDYKNEIIRAAQILYRKGRITDTEFNRIFQPRHTQRTIINLSLQQLKNNKPSISNECLSRNVLK